MEVHDPSIIYAPIVPVLEQFAKDRGLLIERFRHGGPSWDFLFRHPKGGGGKIQVLPAHVEGYTLVALWEVHDLPARKRMWKRSELKQAPPDPQAVREQLDLLLREVMAWEGGDWTNVMQHYPDVPDSVIANAIDRDARLPLPRLSD